MNVNGMHVGPVADGKRFFECVRPVVGILGKWKSRRIPGSSSGKGGDLSKARREIYIDRTGFRHK